MTRLTTCLVRLLLDLCPVFVFDDGFRLLVVVVVIVVLMMSLCCCVVVCVAHYINHSTTKSNCVFDAGRVVAEVEIMEGLD